MMKPPVIVIEDVSFSYNGRMAKQMRDNYAVRKGLTITHSALLERLAFMFAYTRGGLITQVPVLRSIFSRWRYLTLEIGRY